VTLVVASDDGEAFAYQELPRALLEDEEAVAAGVAFSLNYLDAKIAELWAAEEGKPDDDGR
jgi:hypothetical protein